MNLTELLNSDMTTIGRELRRGFDWWRGELASMLPASLAGSGRRLAAFHRLDRDGAVIVATTRDVDTLVIDRDWCLLRTLQLPRMAESEIASMIALDADRIMPVTADQIVLGTRVTGPGQADGTVDVCVGALPLARAASIAEALSAANIAPRHVGPLDDSGAILAVDLAPAMRKAGLLPPRPPIARMWWIAVAVLALLNVGVAVLRDQQQVQHLQDLVDSQSPALMVVRKVEDRLRDNAHRVAALDAKRHVQQPLRLLAALGAALPAKAWISRVEWDGTQMRLSGYAADGVNVVSAMKASPAFVAVRASRAETLADTNAGKPFDLTATTNTRALATGAIQPQPTLQPAPLPTQQPAGALRP